MTPSLQGGGSFSINYLLACPAITRELSKLRDFLLSWLSICTYISLFTEVYVHADYVHSTICQNCD